MPHDLDPATPLAEVTFCVLDLETTGGAPQADAITELGAVLVRGGECLGTFQTFVHPGIAIPSRITYLTGITEAMVAHAPRPESVLPAFLEFLGSSVVVGHNVRFDVAFLDAALGRAGYPALTGGAIDTCALARRLVRDEVPDCRLATLAERLRLDHRPTHRALTDALATTDLLHALLERAASYAVFTLDDLLTLHRQAGHPHAAKLRLTDELPRSPGVYELFDRDGRLVYVGKATNLRARVRSYFGNDDRRTIRPMLAALDRIDHRRCGHTLAAEVIESRLLHTARPRFNRAGLLPRRPTWLKLTAEPFPRLATTARPGPGDSALGPFPTLATARRAQEAIEAAIPIRRCSLRPGASGGPTEPCAPAQLGVSHCPCAGTTDATGYRPAVEAARRALLEDPGAVTAALGARMFRLAAGLRFEEAALTRDRCAQLVAAHRDRATWATVAGAGRVELTIGGGGATIDGGLLVAAWSAEGPVPLPSRAVRDPRLPAAVPDAADLAEARLIARWLVRNRHRWHSVEPAFDDELVRRAVDSGLAPPAQPGRAQHAGARSVGVDHCPTGVDRQHRRRSPGRQ